MPVEPSEGYTGGLESQVRGAYAVVPDDSDWLLAVTRALYVGVSGDVKVTWADGSVTTLVGLAAGVWHPIRVKRVWATGTTATGIVAGY